MRRSAARSWAFAAILRALLLLGLAAGLLGDAAAGGDLETGAPVSGRFAKRAPGDTWQTAPTCCPGCSYLPAKCCCAPGGAGTTTVTVSLSKSGGITKTITLTKQTSKAARGLDDLEDAADSEGGTLEARAAAGSRFLCPVCGPDAKPSRRGLFDTLGFGKRAVLYCCPAKKTVTVTMSSGTVVPTKTDAPSPPGPPLPTPGTGGIIRGLVYYDVNKDGKISAGEPPIAERWLFVRGPDGSILARAKTAKDGSYQLRTGKFFKKTKLSLTLLTAPARPVAYFITGSAGNADVIVGLRPPTYRGTLYVSMGGPKNTRGRESGTAARRAALASGSTALQDIKAGDIPLANQVVALRFMNGSIWKKVTTDSYGEWSLETRKRYPYLKLVATAMNGKVQRPFRADGNGYTDPIDMPVPGAVIQGLVWLDADGNNQPGSSEPLAKGMTLQIRRADDGSLIKEVITNVLGKFKFSMVPMPKVAVVIYSAGGEKLRSFSTDASGNANVMVPLQAGPVPNPGTIDGILFADVNNDGVQDADEPVLPGVTIDIRTQDGTVVGTATSDANGAFSVQLTPQVNTVMEIVGTDGTVYQSFQTDATGSATVQVGVAEPPAPADSTTVKPVPTTPAPVPTTAKPVAKTTARVPATTAAPGRITATTTTISGAASKSTTTSSAAPPPPPPTLSPGATTTASATPTTQTLPSGATSTASPTPTTQTLPSGATSTDSTTVTTQTSTTEESTTTSVSSEASNVLTTVASADPTPVTLTTPVTHPAGATTSRTIVTLTTGPNGPGIVQGTVWYDINGDGSLDSDDAPYVDRLVEIRWVNGTLFTTVMTNSTGGFFFVTDQIYPGVVLHASAANGLSRTKVFTTDMNGNMQMWIPVPPGVIEGAVWNDMNSDGQQNVGETPVTNLDLVVTFPNSTELARVTTDTNGQFVIRGIPYPSQVFHVYTTDATLVGVFTTNQDGNAQPMIPVTPSRISGEVFYDLNRNGIRDNNETAYAGSIEIRFASDSSLIGTSTTASTGDINFPLLKHRTTSMLLVIPGRIGLQKRFMTDSNGNAVVSYPLPPALIEGVAFYDANGDGVQDSGEPLLVNSRIEIRSRATGAIVLRLMTNNTGGFGRTIAPSFRQTFDVYSSAGTLYQSFTTDGEGNALVSVPIPMGRVSGMAWFDVNQNTLRDTSEVAYPLKIVTIRFSNNNTIVGTGPTDATGAFNFAILPFPSTAFTASVTAPGGRTITRSFTTDAKGNAGGIALPLPPAIIQGQSWYDTNKDGVQQPGELSLVRSTVDIVFADNFSVVAQVQTDDNGAFSIAVIPYALTTMVAGVGGFNFKNFTTTATGDAAVMLPLRTADIAITLFFDMDKNGKSSNSDIPLANERVLLLLDNGNPYASATTAADGSFAIDNVPAQPNTVVLVQRASYPFAAIGRFTTDANGNAAMEIPVPPAEIQGRMWYSATGALDQPMNVASGDVPLANSFVDVRMPNGTLIARAQTDSAGAFAVTLVPYPNSMLSIYHPNGMQVRNFTTDIAGDAVVPAPLPLPRIRGKIWYDYDNNTLWNSPPDKPVAGLPMNLVRTGGSIYATVRLDANGNFSYMPHVNLTSPNMLLSLIDPANGRTYGMIQLDRFGSGSVDIPLAPPAPVITGIIFFDMNGNGLLDSSDVGYKSGRTYGQTELRFSDGSIYMTTFIGPEGNFTFMPTRLVKNQRLGIFIVNASSSALGYVTTDAYGAGFQNVPLPRPWISGTIWYDVSADQNYTSGVDLPSVGETFVFKLPNGTDFGTVTTTAGGKWTLTDFVPLPSGAFQVARIGAPSTPLGWIWLDPFSNGTGLTPLDAVYIRGTAWFDADKNSMKDGNETPLASSWVWITWPNGTQYGSKYKTNATGDFAIPVIPISGQAFSFILPTGYPLLDFTAGIDGSATFMAPIPSSEIGFRAWYDILNNSYFDPSADKPLAGYGFELRSRNGSLYTLATAASDGSFTYTAPIDRSAPNDVLTVIDRVSRRTLGTITLDRFGSGYADFPLAPLIISVQVYFDMTSNNAFDLGTDVPYPADLQLLFSSNGTVYEQRKVNSDGIFILTVDRIVARTTFQVVAASDPSTILGTFITDSEGEGVVSIPLAPPRISGRLFVDVNKDSTYNFGDQLVAGEPISLVFAANNSVYVTGTTLTDGTFAITPAVPAPSETLFLRVANGQVMGNLTTSVRGSGTLQVAIPPPTVGFRAWWDYANNSLWDGSSLDKPLASRAVDLVLFNGTVYKSLTTSANGNVSYTATWTSVMPNADLTVVERTWNSTIGTITLDQYGAGYADFIFEPLPPSVYGTIFFDMNGNNLYNQATDRPYSGDLLLKYTNGTTLARTTIDNRGNFTFSLPAYMPNTAFRIVLADGVSVMATIQTDQYGVGTAWLALPPPYIAGTLWIDANDDGTYNSGTDQTLANEQVQLIFPDSGIIYATLTTSANGTWYVDPATHGSIPLQTVAVILSTGSILKNFTTDAKGSAFVPGPVPPATISLRVWWDFKNDTIWNGASLDKPLANRAVSVFYNNGSLLRNLTTDSSGYVTFLAKWPSEITPNEVLVVMDSASGDMLGNFPLDEFSAGTGSLSLAAPAPSVVAKVFYDTGRDNISVAGVDPPYIDELALCFANGTVLATAYGDSTGNVTVTLPDYLRNQVLYLKPKSNLSHTFATVQLDSYGMGNSWVTIPPATVEGQIWVDFNNNGYFDSGDVVIPNYDVAALYDNETVAGNTTTLTNGYFSFNFAQPMPNTNFTVILTATQKKVGTILTNFLGNAYVDLRLPSEDTRAITVSSTTKVLYAGGVLSSGAFALGTNIISNSDANQTSSDAWVAAVDNTGAVMWLRGFGSPDGNEKVLGIAVDDSETAYGSGAGDVYVVGSFTSSSMDFDGTTLSNAGAVGVPDIFVARLDGRNGTTVWATRFGSAQADEALGVAVSIKSAHIYIVGYYSANIVFGSTTLQNAGNEDGFVVQLSTVDGAAGWAMRQYGSGIEILRGVAVDRSNTKDYGSVVVTGQYSSTSYYPGDGSAWGSRGSDDAIFFRYEYDTGKFMHGRAWGGTGSDVSMSIAIHPGTGNIYCTGTSTSTSVTYTGGFLDPITKSGTGRSIWVAKHDAYGNREWYKVFQGSGTGDDAAYAVQVDPMSEDVFVTGVIGSSGGITFGSTTVASRMYLLQMKKSGYVRRATGLPTSFNSIFNQAWALHVDRRSNVWVGGGGASVDGQGVGAQVTSTISAFAGAAFLGLHDDQLAAQTTPSEWTILGSGGWTSGKAEDKAFDGSLYTSVDTSANNSYFGLDLGRPRTLERIKWLCTQEELGLCGNTSFEVADDAAFNNAIQIHYWKLMPRRGWMYIDFRGLTAHRYFRVVPNDGQSGSHTVEVELYATEDEVLATGRVIGDGNVVWNGYLYDTDQSRAFDNNWDSYFESGANTAWTGIDVGFRTTLRRIRFLPRKSWESRMVGGKFQASNDHTFSTGVVDVYTITSPPMYYIYNEPTFTPKGPYRYFRYLTPTGGFGNVAEIEFYVDNNQTMSHYHVRIASATNLGQYCGAYYRQNAWDFDNTTYYEACSGTTNNYVGQDMHNPWRVVKVGVQPRTGYASRAAGAEFQVSYVEDFDAYSEIWNLAKVNSTPPENQVTYFDVSPVPYNAVPATRYPRWLAANNTLGGDPVELEFLVNPDVRQRSLESYCYSYGAFNWVAMCTTAPTDNMLQIELVPWETWMGGTSLAGGPWKRGQVVEATGASYKQTAKDRWFIVHFGDTIYAKMVLIHIYATGTWGQIYVVKADSGYTATMGSSPTAAQINAAWAQRAPHSDYYVTRAVIAHYGQQTGFAAVP